MLQKLENVFYFIGHKIAEMNLFAIYNEHQDIPKFQEKKQSQTKFDY